MKNQSFLIGLILLGTVFSGCKKDREPNKIISPLPVKTDEIVIPGNAAQQMMLLKKSMIRVVVTAINKTTFTNPVYPELTSLGGSSYSFNINEGHFGSATYTIQFRDASNGVIDPIAAQTSSTTIKSVAITGTGASVLFPSYTEAATLTLEIAGNINSVMILTGNVTFTGSGYSIPFDISSPGARVNLEGLRDGAILVTVGTGPGGAVTMSLALSNDHSANGPLAWDGQIGGIHISNSGDGFVTTPVALIPLN